MVAARDANSEVKLGREGRPTAAAFLCMRVLKDEARVDQGILPIERHTVKIHKAFGVYVDVHVVISEDVIGRARLGIEFELIAQPGAAAAQDTEAQAALRDFLPPERLADLVYRFGGHRHHRSNYPRSAAFFL